MDKATTIIQAGIAKILTLILAAGVCIVVAGAVGFVIARRNPQWSNATKRLVHSVSMFTAAIVFAVFAVVWIRGGA
jgi:hypothetical protein